MQDLSIKCYQSATVHKYGRNVHFVLYSTCLSRVKIELNWSPLPFFSHLSHGWNFSCMSDRVSGWLVMVKWVTLCDTALLCGNCIPPVATYIKLKPANLIECLAGTAASNSRPLDFQHSSHILSVSCIYSLPEEDGFLRAFTFFCSLWIPVKLLSHTVL